MDCLFIQADTTNSAGADDDIALGDLTEQESNAENQQVSVCHATPHPVSLITEHI